MVDAVMAWPADTRLAVLAPIARGKKGSFEDECASLQAQGYVRLRVDGQLLEIDGMAPLRRPPATTRSTVGTITEIHDYLRLLYARVGTPYCPDHGLPLQAQSVSQMVDAVMAWPADTRLAVLAPIARGKKGSFEDECASLQAQGYVRLRVDGQLLEIDGMAPLKKSEKHDIDVVIDRLPESKQRLAEFRNRLATGRGPRAGAGHGQQPRTGLLQRYACPVCSHRDLLRLSERKGPQHGQAPHFRRRDPEPGAPLARDRFGHRARRAGQVPQHQDLPRLRRLAPAARGPQRADRPGPRGGERQGQAIYEVEPCRCRPAWPGSAT